MRSFTDLDALIGMVPSQVVTRLSAIGFGRGSEALYRDQMPGLLTELADRARVLSITASSAIEGVIVADADRARRIIDRRTTTLRNRSERELAGYRDAQDYLFREDWHPLNAGLTLHLHRLLFAHTRMPGGAFKKEDDLVVDRSPDGSTTVRFKPVPAASTPFAVDDLMRRPYPRAAVVMGLLSRPGSALDPNIRPCCDISAVVNGAAWHVRGYEAGLLVSHIVQKAPPER